MKVLFVNTVPLEANGISTFIINSSEGLSGLGVKVTILAPNKVNKKIKNELKQNNINLIEILNRNTKPIKYFIRLRKICLNEQYDVVHVNGNSTTMALELWAAKAAKVKIRIAHSHNTTTAHPFINRMLRPLFESVVNGRIACNNAAGKWLFNNKNYAIIKNGIDLKKYKFDKDIRKKVRNNLNIDDDDLVLGNVGKFNFQKNQQFLIKLLSRMDKKIKLILIGEGKTFEQIKKLSVTFGVQNQVYFLGTQDNVQDYLNAFDLFLLPSNFEGQPFVLVESSANGLMNVVSDKVSSEVNICKNTEFLNLNDYNIWKNKIQNIRSYNRHNISEKYIDILSNNGYDLNKNVYRLLEYYKDKK